MAPKRTKRRTKRRPGRSQDDLLIAMLAAATGAPELCREADRRGVYAVPPEPAATGEAVEVTRD